MKLTKDFTGVPDGAIYPVRYSAGDECPPELEDAARACGAIEDDKGKKPDVKKRKNVSADA